MPLYELQEDYDKAFVTAVNNGQTRLALEYAVLIIRDLQSQIVSLTERVEAMSSASKPTVSSARKETKQTSEAADV